MHPNCPASMRTGHRIATHSGWIELGLVFGEPHANPVFAGFLTSFGNAMHNAYMQK
jgi:hypothetical protein